MGPGGVHKTRQISINLGVKRDIEDYNLDAIISVGYRVNPKEGMQLEKSI